MSMVQALSQTNSSDYYDDDDPLFLDALADAVLPGDQPLEGDNEPGDALSEEELEPPPAAQPCLKRKRSPTPEPEDEPTVEDDIYGPASFGGFGEYMHRKRAKLQIQNDHIAKEGERSQIFKDLSIYINGWTRPSVQELRHLIVQHGGVFQPYLDRKAEVTHILTCSLTPAKIREFKHMKVVRPEWLVESAEKGYLLPWRNYIYIPEDRMETTQGAKSNQQTLRPTGSSTASSSAAPSTSAFPKAPPRPAPAPLYTTDPATRADAARVPGYAADRSNPNAQRAMANPAWRSAHTSVAAGFVEGYYKNSRLHHLATWKTELRGLVQEAQARAEAAPASGLVRKVPAETGVSMRGATLAARSPGKGKGKARAVDGEERVIMHCDFDCFFVSAGLVSRPHLKGKPVVVCHSQGTQGGASSTSEIASSSYEARKFGIKNGMSLQQARKLCPDVTTIPYEFERYKEFSLLFYTVLMEHADDLQAVSVDEALIDVTTTVNQMREQPEYVDGAGDAAKDYAETIRNEIRAATTCEVSVGIAHNILLARLATRHAKPAGSYHLAPTEVAEFLAPLDIGDLHGFGYSTKQKALEKLGVTSLGALATRSRGILVAALGKGTGETLYNAIRGIDDKQLESDKARKSVSCEINYGIRFENNEQAEVFVRQMASEVKKRLDAVDMVGRSLTLKIMKRDPTAPVEPPKFLGHGICDLFNKQGPLIFPGGKATSDAQIIGDHACRLLKSFNFDPRELRGIGIQIQKLESASGSTSAPAGQAVLPFQSKVVGSSKAESSKAVFLQPEVRVPPPPPENPMKNGDPVKPIHASFDPPSFSQVDMSVFAALPEDVRQELESEYKRRSESPFTRAPTAELENHRKGSLPPRPVPGRGNNGSMFPRSNSSKPTDYKRITQQLAPRRGGGIGGGVLPPRNAVHAWVAKLKAKEEKAKGVQISKTKLQELNLDPEVFFALPIRVQREQLTMARIIKATGRVPEPPAKRKILKPKKHVLPPDFVPYIAPKPRARHLEPPFLRQQGAAPGEKLYFTETDDVQRVVEQWLTKYQHWAPREKDVEFVAKFVRRSVDRAQATDVGVERAVAVMKWWLVLLRRTFPAAENLDEDDLKSSQRNLVGEAWWEAFRRVKGDMDLIARERFGGKLSLR